MLDDTKDVFCVNIVKLENNMRFYRLLKPHYQHYTCEMRFKTCSQLQASHSFRLSDMPKVYGVTEEYVENEIATLVGRLHYKIV
jgi:hypothetical protein